MIVLPKRRFECITLAAALATGLHLATSLAEEAPKHSEQPAVVCMSEAGGPVMLRAKGTLTRTKTRDELIYRLEVKEQTYDWRFITNTDRSTTILGPGLLIGKLVDMPKHDQPLQFPRGPINAADSGQYAAPRGQSLDVNGEIREYLGQIRLWVVPGTKCPS